MEPECSLPSSEKPATGPYPTNPPRCELHCKISLHCTFLRRDVVSPRPTPNLEGRPLLANRDPLFNIIAATPESGDICVKLNLYLHFCSAL